MEAHVVEDSCSPERGLNKVRFPLGGEPRASKERIALERYLVEPCIPLEDGPFEGERLADNGVPPVQFTLDAGVSEVDRVVVAALEDRVFECQPVESGTDELFGTLAGLGNSVEKRLRDAVAVFLLR